MLRSASGAAVALLLAAAPIVAQQTPAAPAVEQRVHDLIIRNGRLLDGSGNPWLRADVAVTGDRITAVGDLRDARARRVIDATGLYVAPGFVDTHSHAGGALATPALSPARQLLAQGITTVFVNPDGGGPTDLVRQRADLETAGTGVNVALMVPHGGVRQAVLGMADRAPTAAELERMRAIVRAGMQAGAFGLSSGPFYAPGSYARTDELVALARVAAEHGGAYTSHIRDEGDYTIGVVAAVDEVITVAREAGLPGIVTHIKALGPRVWGYGGALVQRIERAREQGIPIFADQYPYDASQTGLSAALVPRWAQAGGGAEFRARVADPAQRARIVAEMTDNLDRRGGAERIRIARFTRDTALEGRTLREIADARGADAVETALALVQQGEVGIVSFNMLDRDIETLMRQPWTMTASDGGLVAAGQGVPHPRGNGAFARKLRKYVVEDEVVDLAAAIRSMTSLPAAVYRMPERGVVRPGAMADLVVFDLAAVRDRATFDDPHQLAEGMRWVLVNGVLAMDEGRFTEEKGGRVLRR